MIIEELLSIDKKNLQKQIKKQMLNRAKIVNSNLKLFSEEYIRDCLLFIKFDHNSEIKDVLIHCDINTIKKETGLIKYYSINEISDIINVNKARLILMGNNYKLPKMELINIATRLLFNM